MDIETLFACLLVAGLVGMKFANALERIARL